MRSWQNDRFILDFLFGQQPKHMTSGLNVSGYHTMSGLGGGVLPCLFLEARRSLGGEKERDTFIFVRSLHCSQSCFSCHPSLLQLGEAAWAVQSPETSGPDRPGFTFHLLPSPKIFLLWTLLRVLTFHWDFSTQPCPYFFLHPDLAQVCGDHIFEFHGVRRNFLEPDWPYSFHSVLSAIFCLSIWPWVGCLASCLT